MQLPTKGVKGSSKQTAVTFASSVTILWVHIVTTFLVMYLHRVLCSYIHSSCTFGDAMQPEWPWRDMVHVVVILHMMTQSSKYFRLRLSAGLSTSFLNLHCFIEHSIQLDLVSQIKLSMPLPLFAWKFQMNKQQFALLFTPKKQFTGPATSCSPSGKHLIWLLVPQLEPLVTRKLYEFHFPFCLKRN